MLERGALTVIDEINPTEIEALKQALGTISEPGSIHDVLEFAMLDNVHFARLVVFDAANDLDGNLMPAQLVMLSNFDGPLDEHLQDLASVCGEGIDAIFRYCRHYPSESERSPVTRKAYLQQHTTSAKALYVNRQGRTVKQIRNENTLVEEIQKFLDRHDSSVQTSLQLRQSIIEFVSNKEDLQWALKPEADTRSTSKVPDNLVFIGIAILLLLLSPILLIVGIIFLFLLRYHEKRDVPDESAASPESIRRFRADEDIGVQNQIIAIGLFKPGWFRKLTSRAILWLTDFACRRIYHRGSLSGLNTIHFARWVEMDDGKRLFFSSNYDGSLESYMNDFIDKAAWGLNAIFSNGDGFPRTAFLFCGGITDEKAYKRFLPTRQVHSRVWYSAYPDLTTKNIANNAEIREGLSANMNEGQAKAWLRRFGVGNRLPESGSITRFLDKIRWEQICRNCN